MAYPHTETFPGIAGEAVTDGTERDWQHASDMGHVAVGAPLDADSELLKHLGSNKMMWPGLAGGTLQLMHPAISAGVNQHSTFFADELGRINRSLPLIYGAAYDENAAETGRKVRDIHRDIKGIDHNGNRYHALNPDTWQWAHATFVYMAMKVATKYSRGDFTQKQREQMYDESRTWYQNWGVSDTPVPETYDEFKEYWDDTVEHELEMTPAATQAIVQALGGEAPRPAFIPEQLWPMLEVPVMPVANHLKLLTIGELPPRVRERFHLPFSHMDKARLNLFRAAVASTDLLPIPDKIKYHPRAYAGLQRLRQQ